jgi:hypothetical protein
MTMKHSGWGVRFLDFDNDGWKDLLITQGHAAIYSKRILAIIPLSS